MPTGVAVVNNNTAENMIVVEVRPRGIGSSHLRPNSPAHWQHLLWAGTHTRALLPAPGGLSQPAVPPPLPAPPWPAPQVDVPPADVHGGYAMALNWLHAGREDAVLSNGAPTVYKPRPTAVQYNGDRTKWQVGSCRAGLRASLHATLGLHQPPSPRRHRLLHPTAAPGCCTRQLRSACPLGRHS